MVLDFFIFVLLLSILWFYHLLEDDSFSVERKLDELVYRLSLIELERWLWSIFRIFLCFLVNHSESIRCPWSLIIIWVKVVLGTDRQYLLMEIIGEISLERCGKDVSWEVGHVWCRHVANLACTLVTILVVYDRLASHEID